MSIEAISDDPSASAKQNELAVNVALRRVAAGRDGMS